MAETKRTLSDIRPGRSMDGVNRVPRTSPPAAPAKPAEPTKKPAQKIVDAPMMDTPAVTQPVAQAAIPAEPKLAVEEFKELSAPKSGSGHWLQILVGLIIIGLSAYGIYLLYVRNYQ